VKDDLDLERMRRAAALFAGMKNFQSFSADDPEEKSPLVQIDRVEVGEAGDLILVRIEGSHFLWRMVRRIVGVIVEAGKGSLSMEAIAGFFEVLSAQPAGLAAPAAGLFLERVYYEGDPRISRLQPVIMIGSDDRNLPPSSHGRQARKSLRVR
jgi:tRNA pseudouridine38-40 synthase